MEKGRQFGLAVAIDGAMKLALLCSIQPKRLEQPVEVLHLAEHDAEIGQPHRFQGLRRQRQHVRPQPRVDMVVAVQMIQAQARA